jgi:Fe-S-cluster containining protein
MEHARFHKTDIDRRHTSGDDLVRTACCLRMHARYRCRHSGACCTAGWDIPVEGPVYEVLRVHFGTSGALFETGGPLPEGAAAVLARRPAGDCVFFEREPARLCAVHRELGEDRLPTACRQFPRVVLHDARGVLISLSHYCPTAAALLLDPHPIEIISAPPSLALRGEVEGLDARDALPPLLRRGMLSDSDGYAAWERRALETLGGDDGSADCALAKIAAATRNIQAWEPGASSLRATVDRAFDVALAREPDEDLDADLARARVALASVPRGLPAPSYDGPGIGFRQSWAAVSDWWPVVDHPVRAYLAARLFGNWVAYHALGLHAVVEYLRVCRSVLKVEAALQQSRASTSPWQTVLEAIRNADLLLVHLSDPKHLSRRLS